MSESKPLQRYSVGCVGEFESEDGRWCKYDFAKAREKLLLDALVACVKRMQDDGYHDDTVCDARDLLAQFDTEDHR